MADVPGDAGSTGGERLAPAGHSRRLARERAVQALYQWQLTGQSARRIIEQYLEDTGPPSDGPVETDRELEDVLAMDQVDVEFFTGLVNGVLDRLEEWDAQITPHLDRSFANLDPTERVLLRLGCFELNERLDIPLRVVINEYVELAKRFGAQDSYKYINSLLDRVARGHRLRAVERDLPPTGTTRRRRSRPGRRS